MHFNDNLIDLRVKHLVFRLAPSVQTRLHAFNCMFYTKLLEKGNKKKGHELVARWTDQTCILHMDSLSMHPSSKIGEWLKQ